MDNFQSDSSFDDIEFNKQTAEYNCSQIDMKFSGKYGIRDGAGNGTIRNSLGDRSFGELILVKDTDPGSQFITLSFDQSKLWYLTSNNYQNQTIYYYNYYLNSSSYYALCSKNEHLNGIDIQLTEPVSQNLENLDNERTIAHKNLVTCQKADAYGEFKRCIEKRETTLSTTPSTPPTCSNPCKDFDEKKSSIEGKITNARYDIATNRCLELDITYCNTGKKNEWGYWFPADCSLAFN